jgi:hypothetical protein
MSVPLPVNFVRYFQCPQKAHEHHLATKHGRCLAPEDIEDAPYKASFIYLILCSTGDGTRGHVLIGIRDLMHTLAH